MQAGRLRHRIVVERRLEERGSDGMLVTSYEPLFETWAEIAPVSGREFFGGQQVQGEVTTKITMRWRAGLDSTCRIRDLGSDGFVYDIVAPLPDKTLRRWLVLMCTMRVAEGWRRGE